MYFHLSNRILVLLSIKNETDKRWMNTRGLGDNFQLGLVEKREDKKFWGSERGI